MGQQDVVIIRITNVDGPVGRTVVGYLHHEEKMRDAVRVRGRLYALIDRCLACWQRDGAVADLAGAAADVNRARCLVHVNIARLPDCPRGLRGAKG